MKKLPPPGEELLELAIADLEKCEDDSRYVINMYDWHSPILRGENAGRCSVCLAGAVMAKSCRGGPHEPLSPALFDDETAASLSWLNHVRGHSGVDYEKNKKAAIEAWRAYVKKTHQKRAGEPLLGRANGLLEPE